MTTPLILAALAIATAILGLTKSLVEVLAQSRKTKQSTAAPQPEVQELREHLDKTKIELSNLAQRYQRLNRWLIFLSVALLGASLIYYFWPSKQKEQKVEQPPPHVDDRAAPVKSAWLDLGGLSAQSTAQFIDIDFRRGSTPLTQNPAREIQSFKDQFMRAHPGQVPVAFIIAYASQDGAERVTNARVSRARARFVEDILIQKDFLLGGYQTAEFYKSVSPRPQDKFVRIHLAVLE